MNEGADRSGVPVDAILSLLLKDPVIRRHVLSQPALVVMLTEHAAAVSTLDCAAMQQQLAAYLDAERRSMAADLAYQPLVRHLDHCPQCMELYQAACDIITAQAAGMLPSWPQLSSAPEQAAS